jgi:two-component system, OmpR family, response regulator
VSEVAKVLIVEDDTVIADGMARHLASAGFDPVVVGKGEQGLARLRFERPDVLVLDLMLPERDGWSVIEAAREEGISTPIVVVSARGTEHDRVHALEIGADDYLVKPFSLAELLARLRALARRGPVERPAALQVGNLYLDPATLEVRRGEAQIVLTAREFGVLEAFMRRPGQVLTHDQLLAIAWDLAFEYRSNVVEVYVRYLREKVDRPFGLHSLETVRGLGYRLRRDGGR